MSPRSRSKKLKIPDKLKDQLQQVETCFGTSCNMCERDCPVYRVLRNRTLTSRAKNRALLGAIKGHYPLNEEFAKAIFSCTMCGLCDARCALDNTERFKEIRRALAKGGLTTEYQNKSVDAIKVTGDVYGRTIDTVEMFKEYADGFIPVYIGCTYKGAVNEVKEALQVLDALGPKPQVSQELCCGNVADLIGLTDDFDEIRKAFLGSYPFKEFLTVCPSCTHVFRKLYGLEVQNIVEYVHENLEKLKRLVRPLGLKVTYHDPCDLGRRLGIYDQPREILKVIGAHVVEMELSREFSLCCGAGGGLLAYDHELADEIGKKRLMMAADTGVNILVTACPTCEIQLMSAAMLARKEIGRRIKVLSIWSLVKKAMI